MIGLAKIIYYKHNIHKLECSQFSFKLRTPNLTTQIYPKILVAPAMSVIVCKVVATCIKGGFCITESDGTLLKNGVLPFVVGVSKKEVVTASGYKEL